MKPVILTRRVRAAPKLGRIIMPKNAILSVPPIYIGRQVKVIIEELPQPQSYDTLWAEPAQGEKE